MKKESLRGTQLLCPCMQHSSCRWLTSEELALVRMGAKGIWYADDGGARGSLKDVRIYMWDSLCKDGPPFGYHPKPEKTWLVVKPGLLEEVNPSFRASM